MFLVNLMKLIKTDRLVMAILSLCFNGWARILNVSLPSVLKASVRDSR